jgi:2-octaprenyl-6-methoxyphenol hydroxylase
MALEARPVPVPRCAWTQTCLEKDAPRKTRREKDVMPSKPDAPQRATENDVLVVGAGASGLACALALHRQGLRVALVGRIETPSPGRTVALLDGSVRFFRALQLWPQLSLHAAPLATMRLIDDTDSLFRPPPVAFRAEEIGLEAFGWNIENRDLLAILAGAAAAAGIHPIDTRIEALALASNGAIAIGADGSRHGAGLIVAADGAASATRAAAGIAVRQWRYPQVALTALLDHSRPHADTSTEFHTRHGPFTLVPLLARAGEPHRSSLVWLTEPRRARALQALDSDRLALTIERQGHSILGKMRLETGLGALAMRGLVAERIVAQRLALVGEAAHVFPPIAAQGLNLGLRDIADLADSLAGCRDAGAEAGLAEYQSRRQRDIALRTAAVDILNRSLLSDFLPADFLRGAGLLAISAIGPLRRAVMRSGVMPGERQPRLMRSGSGRAGA